RVLHQRVHGQPDLAPLAGRARDERRGHLQAGPDRLRLAAPDRRRRPGSGTALPDLRGQGAPDLLAPSGAATTLAAVIGEEIGRLLTWEKRHERLLARLAIALGLTLAFDVVGSILTFFFERHAHDTDIHSLGDA